MQLALLMHKLFTYFDDTVHANGLFKMDTIGDAYIVAALLSEDHSSKKQCLGMMAVAKAMIEALGQHHRDTGEQLHCRIGLAVGDVTTGVLGHLQPRFHITGPGLQAAESLEQTAPMQDTLHASEDFLKLVSDRANGTPPDGWHILAPPAKTAGITLGLSSGTPA